MCSSATRSDSYILAVPKGGPRAPLFCLAGLLWATLVLPAAARAQDTVERGALERCAGLKTAIDRLACFESLAGTRDSDAEEQPEASRIEAPPASGMETPESGAGTPRQSAEPADRTEPAEPEPTSPAPRRPDSTASDDLGAEHLDRDTVEEKPEAVTARVKEVWKGGNRLLYFQFTNGQVWRQMESGYFYYPRDSEFDVTIRQGLMGDYQMRAEGRARMTRIVRVK